MGMHKPSELFTFLQSIGASPKRGLSQNFLIDGNVVDKILALAKIPDNSCAIEIGPGPGVLTEKLRTQVRFLVTIEADHTFAKAISRFSPDISLDQDVMTVDLPKLCGEIMQRGIEQIHVISNLPYHLSSPILAKLLPLNKYIQSCTFMLQDEFAQRLLCEHTCTKEYGRLSILRQLYSDVDHSFLVKASSFYPKPKINSRVVRLKLRPSLISSPELSRSFLEFVKKIFEQRRKTLAKSLKHHFKLNPSNLDPKFQEFLSLRPEELNIKQLITIFEDLAPYTNTRK